MYVVYRTIDSCNPCVGVFYNCKFDVITDSTEDSGTNDLLYCFPREGRDTNKLVAVRGMFLTLSNVMSDIANYPAKMWAHIIILTRTQRERLCYYSDLCSLDFASLLAFFTASHKILHEVKVEYKLLKIFDMSTTRSCGYGKVDCFVVYIDWYYRSSVMCEGRLVHIAYAQSGRQLLVIAAPAEEITQNHLLNIMQNTTRCLSYMFSSLHR